ncbi:MAG: hypothetical protein GEV03_03780 [Streptosporangiales bacterium]|nr:hypothetical protein [Streptosporangiales bacterium]
MTLSAEMKKLRESKAFYAAAGAGDLAVEKLREVPEQLRKIEGAKGARRELSGRAQTYAAQLTEKAVEVYGELGARAAEAYEGLAERGKHVVGDHADEEPAMVPSQIEPEATPPTRSTRQTTGAAKTGTARKSS